MNYLPNWEEWGIEYLSPSHINKYNDNKAAWVAHYIHGIKEIDLMPAALRGQASEHAIEKYLMDELNVDDTKVEAKSYFTRNVKEFEERICAVLDPKTYTQEFNDVPAYTQQGIDLFDKLLSNSYSDIIGFSVNNFIPSTDQDRRLQLFLEQYNILLMGYYDFEFETSIGNMTFDNKATKRMPTYDKVRSTKNLNFTGGKPEHRKQVAFYATARGDDYAALAYATPKTHGIALLGKSEIEKEYKYLLDGVDSIATTLYIVETVSGGDIEKARYVLTKMYQLSLYLDSYHWKDSNGYKQEYIDRCLESIKGWNL